MMKKQILFSVLACVLTLTLILGGTYAYYKPKITSSDLPVSIVTKSINLDVDYTGNVSSVLSNLKPESDTVGLTKTGFEFSITNDSDSWKFYKIKINDLGVNQNQTKINSLDLKFNLSEKNNPDKLHTYTYTELKNNPIFSDKLEPNETKEYVLRAWINEDCDNDSINAAFNFQLLIEEVATPYSYQLLDELNISHNFSEVIACNQDHSECDTYSKVKSAINEDDFVASNVYIYGDLSFDSQVTIESAQSVMLDLNGFSLTRTETSDAIDVEGSLVINDSFGTGNFYNSNTSGARLIYTSGSLIINGGRFITDGDNAPFRAGKSGVVTGHITINNGSFYITNALESDSLFKIYSEETNPLIINNAFAYLENTSLFDFSSSITDVTSTHVHINGGMFINNSWPNIYINDPGTLTITSQSNRVYILGKQKDGLHPIYNDDVGTINIVGANANACTKEPLDTTSGICVYAEGNKDYRDDKANGAVINSSSGVININGGTYYGGHAGIYNYKKGTMTIKNAVIRSNYYAVINGSSSSNAATMTICSSSLNGTYKDIRQKTSTGLYYYNVTFRNGSNTLHESNYNNSAGFLTKLDSCPF